MKKLNTLIAILSILTLASCSTKNYTYRESLIPNKNVISGEVVVDVKLNLTKKIEAVSSPRNSFEEAKEEAYYNAIIQNNIDVIVDPIYEVTTTDKILFWGGKSTAKINGFGAVYANPRTKIEAINELNKTESSNMAKFNSIYTESPKAAEPSSNGSFLSKFKL